MRLILIGGTLLSAIGNGRESGGAIHLKFGAGAESEHLEPEAGASVLTVDRGQEARVLLDGDWYLARVGVAVGDEVDGRAGDDIAVLVDLINVAIVNAD